MYKRFNIDVPRSQQRNKKKKIRMSYNVNSTELYIKIIIMISYMCLRYYFLPLIIIIIITVVLLVEIHNKQCEFNATILDRHGGHEEEAYTRKEICELQTWKEKKKKKTMMMMKINKYKKKVEKKRKSLKINFRLPRVENCLNKKCLENLAKHKNKLSLEASFLWSLLFILSSSSSSSSWFAVYDTRCDFLKLDFMCLSQPYFFGV